jgi:hypothetical protein
MANKDTTVRECNLFVTSQYLLHNTMSAYVELYLITMTPVRALPVVVQPQFRDRATMLDLAGDTIWQQASEKNAHAILLLITSFTYYARCCDVVWVLCRSFEGSSQRACHEGGSNAGPAKLSAA